MEAKSPGSASPRRDAGTNDRTIRVDGARRLKVAQYDAQRLRRVMDDAQRQARIATVLASPLRCATLSLLSTYPVMSVGDVATLTETTLALASYHLRQLEAEGLVSIAKAGREHHVRLCIDAFVDMIRVLNRFALPD